MSTALATIDTGTYLALQEGGAIAEAMEANLGEGASLRESDLTRVTIPTGGSTTWIIPGLRGDEPAKTIEGILVYMTVRGILWPKAEPEEGSLPALVSHDLKTARRVSDDLSADFLRSIEDARTGVDTYDWAKLPQTQWGSGKDGAGKAAKEQRVLYILRQGDPLPLVVVIQPGSLKDWQKFVLAMTKAGIPYWRAVVSLGLEKTSSSGGQPFSKVVPQLAGELTPEQGAVIREKFTEPMKGVAASSFAA